MGEQQRYPTSTIDYIIRDIPSRIRDIYNVTVGRFGSIRNSGISLYATKIAEG
jgi:hypothetical protein